MAPVASKVESLPNAQPANDNVAHAIAGAGGGMLATVLTYPLITLSTRAQVESKRTHSSFVAAAEHIVVREGVRGLYAGLDSAVFGIGVTNFVYYYWYEWTRAFFERAAAARAGRGGSSRHVASRLSTLEAMVAGAIAGSATVILTNPIWVVNTRMTTRRTKDWSCDEEKALAAEGQVLDKTDEDDKGDKGDKGKEGDAVAEGKAPAPTPSLKGPTTLGTLLALLRDEGPQALFAGIVPALVLVINPILQYTLFEQLKNALQARRPGKPFTPGLSFLLGAISKLFATGITYPYITVKSRMHVAKTRNEGVTAALRRVMHDEGYAGLYKGIGPKITQSVFTAAFLFAFKDVLYAQTVRLRSAKR